MRDVFYSHCARGDTFLSNSRARYEHGPIHSVLTLGRARSGNSGLNAKPWSCTKTAEVQSVTPQPVGYSYRIIYEGMFTIYSQKSRYRETCVGRAVVGRAILQLSHVPTDSKDRIVVENDSLNCSYRASTFPKDKPLRVQIFKLVSDATAQAGITFLLKTLSL